MTKTNPKKMLYRKREISATPIQLHFKDLYGERYPLTLAPHPEMKAEVLKMLPEAAGRGQHFQARGHSFSLYGPTLSRQITYLFFSCDKIGLQLGLRNFV